MESIRYFGRNRWKRLAGRERGLLEKRGEGLLRARKDASLASGPAKLSLASQFTSPSPVATRQWRAAKLPGQRRNVVGSQGTEERFEYDFQIPETRAEIVVKRIHCVPGLICRERIGRKFLDSLVKFAADAVDRSGKYSQFLKEPSSRAEKDDVEEAVPRSGVLCCASAKVTGLERLDGRDARVLAAVAGDRPASTNQNVGETGDQIGSHHNLFAGADNLAAGAKRKCVAECDAHHGVRALPLLDDGIKKVAFFTGERGKPVLRHPPARGSRSALGKVEHPMPPKGVRIIVLVCSRALS
jgi:hypothetical protein